MPLRRTDSANCSLVDVVAHRLVLQVGVPVDLDRAGDVALLIEQHILVGFDDRRTRLCRSWSTAKAAVDQKFGVGVVLDSEGLRSGGTRTATSKPSRSNVRPTRYCRRCPSTAHPTAEARGNGTDSAVAAVADQDGVAAVAAGDEAVPPLPSSPALPPMPPALAPLPPVPPLPLMDRPRRRPRRPPPLPPFQSSLQAHPPALAPLPLATGSPPVRAGLPRGGGTAAVAEKAGRCGRRSRRCRRCKNRNALPPGACRSHRRRRCRTKPAVAPACPVTVGSRCRRCRSTLRRCPRRRRMHRLRRSRRCRTGTRCRRYRRCRSCYRRCPRFRAVGRRPRRCRRHCPRHRSPPLPPLPINPAAPPLPPACPVARGIAVAAVAIQPARRPRRSVWLSVAMWAPLPISGRPSADSATGAFTARLWAPAAIAANGEVLAASAAGIGRSTLSCSWSAQTGSWNAAACALSAWCAWACALNSSAISADTSSAPAASTAVVWASRCRRGRLDRQTDIRQIGGRRPHQLRRHADKRHAPHPLLTGSMTRKPPIVGPTQVVCPEARFLNFLNRIGRP